MFAVLDKINNDSGHRASFAVPDDDAWGMICCAYNGAWVRVWHRVRFAVHDSGAQGEDCCV